MWPSYLLCGVYGPGINEGQESPCLEITERCQPLIVWTLVRTGCSISDGTNCLT